MTKSLIAKKDAALQAIQEVHNDTSGPASENLDAMQEIRERAQEIENLLKADCEG